MTTKVLILLTTLGLSTDGIDVLAIPRDWCQKIEVMEIVGECTYREFGIPARIAQMLFNVEQLEKKSI